VVSDIGGIRHVGSHRDIVDDDTAAGIAAHRVRQQRRAGFDAKEQGTV
jgi:hypothetical protein